MLPFVKLLVPNHPVYLLSKSHIQLPLHVPVTHTSVKYVLERNTFATIFTTELLASDIAKYLV